MCVSRWETSLNFGFLGQMLHRSGMWLDAIAMRCDAVNAMVRSVSGADKLRAKGQCMQRDGVQYDDTKGACWVCEAGGVVAAGSLQI